MNLSSPNPRVLGDSLPTWKLKRNSWQARKRHFCFPRVQAVGMRSHTPRRDRGWDWKYLNLSAFIYSLSALFHRGFGGTHSKRPFRKVMQINRNTQVGIRRHKLEGIQTREHQSAVRTGRWQA